MAAATLIKYIFFRYPVMLKAVRGGGGKVAECVLFAFFLVF